MICIRINGHEGAVRTTLEIAERMVAEGRATYSSKGAWKASGRNYFHG